MLAEPIVRVVYQRGDFTAAQTPATAAALAAFSLGLAFNGFMLMFNRAFFSLQRAWLPTWVALGNLGLNAILDASFYRFGIWGIPLSTSIVNIAGTVALAVLLQRELGRLELRETLDTVLRITIAGCTLGLVSYGVWRGLHSALGNSFLAALVGVLAALGAGLGVYLLFARLLRIRELQALLSLRARVRRA